MVLLEAAAQILALVGAVCLFLLGYLVLEVLAS
jgi:hypothetical protein